MCEEPIAAGNANKVTLGNATKCSYSLGMTATLSCPKQSQMYRPRRPEKTVLFGVVKKHYKTWHKTAKDPIPLYIDKAFKKYLECGILAKGFACAHCGGCNTHFMIAFSCKACGVCPSCNTCAMVETATHLVENLIPCVPTRQWVISFPMRIRHYLLTPKILQDVLKIVIDEIRKKLMASSPSAPHSKIGAISFIQNFGNTLNIHPHFHIIAADGVFSVNESGLLFHEACITPDDILDTQEAIRKRVLKFFGRRGWFDKDAIDKMLTYENSGFSLDAIVKIESWDRDGFPEETVEVRYDTGPDPPWEKICEPPHSDDQEIASPSQDQDHIDPPHYEE